MLCPQCNTENPEGATACRQCNATLNAWTQSDERDFVAVMVTNDAAALAVAKSLLDAERIACEIEGESGQETLGLGPLPGVTGPVRLMVARADEEAARALLAQQDAPAASDE